MGPGPGPGPGVGVSCLMYRGTGCAGGREGPGSEPGPGLRGVPFLMSWKGAGALYSEVQCIMGNGHMESPHGQTDSNENITFPQLRWRAVIRRNTNSVR